MLDKLPSFKPSNNMLELNEDFEIKTDNQLLLIHKGFKFDGASIPNFIWAILDLKPTDGKVLVPALTHDFCYHYKLCSRKKADEIFRQLLIECGVEKWKVQAMYRAVRMFGGKYWDVQRFSEH